jgi:exosortase E/protease (VPEID-CTERM system)
VLVKRPDYLKSLPGRVAVLVVLFSIEALLSPLFRGTTAALSPPHGAWITFLIEAYAASLARFIIAFSALFATFSILRYRAELTPLALATDLDPVKYRLLILHLAAVGLFWLASPGVYGARSASASNWASLFWIAGALVAIASAALAFLPWRMWVALRRATGALWLYSAISAALVWGSTAAFRVLWNSASRLTFAIVQLLLRPFLSNMVIQPEALRIGTPRFHVVVADVCSGLEGMGLLIVFGCMWLFLFRREAKFPQALALLPLGIVTLFLLNSVRLAVLILIGNAGAHDIAMGGFHSQAGWIMFNSVAFGSAVAARHWSWVAVRPTAANESRAGGEPRDSTAAFLIPFLAILAAGMISTAASGAFEWLYSLRLLAAAAALWCFRRSYSHLNWNFGMGAPLTGLAVFLIWIAADRITTSPVAMPAMLAAAPAGFRLGWIVLRALGAIVTVPLAEELAFRGFLLRRFTTADFDSISLKSTTWIALAGSSLLFGLMHGGRWGVATLAGLMFGLLVRRTGRIGDAVAAHAFTNTLLAIWVLGFGHWQLW